MLSNGLSASDVALMSNDGIGGNAGWWILIILFALFGGFGGVGNNTQYATSAEVQRGFDNQNVMTRFDTIGQNISNSMYENAQLINGVNTNMLQTTANMTNAMNSGFNGVNMTLNSGFDGINANINNLSHQLSDCCCSLKTQMLQDKYDSAQNQLNLAEIASANAVQTQNILGTLGRYYTNPPYPYYSGTTIS